MRVSAGAVSERKARMSKAFAEAMHHQTVRTYRRELLLTPVGLKRARLLTLIARAKMTAENEEWPETLD
jgi:hypothetical protein